MSIIDTIASSTGTAFSFEVLPPLKGTGIEGLMSTIDELREFAPRYINITTHRSEYEYRESPGGVFHKVSVRRRPGTVAVAAAIKNRYDIPVVPHILCSGFTREETEYVLLDLQFLGITDLLLLRGDKAKHESTFAPTPGGYSHAIELQQQVNRFNEGYFIDGSPIKEPGKPFTYGVACYPEKHDEAPNMEMDLYWLREKVKAGAQYAVTQLFYDNAKYFDFVARARAEGIDIPIIPGIKPLKTARQLSIIPKTFKVDIPQALAAEVLRCKTDEEVRHVGVEWCIAQCRELIAHGVPSIHFYAMAATDSVKQVARAIY